MSSFYTHHVFFCTNQRAPDPSGQTRPCCASADAGGARDHVKKRIKDLGLSGPGGVRINNAGCLDRCEQGPCIVVYPQGTWYTYVDRQDLDEIIDEHLVHGRVVERLRIPD
jgi:(2Fe-2S) ferredoxin